MYFPEPGITFSSSFCQTILPPAIVTSTFPWKTNHKLKDLAIMNKKHTAGYTWEDLNIENAAKYRRIYGY